MIQLLAESTVVVKTVELGKVTLIDELATPQQET